MPTKRAGRALSCAEARFAERGIKASGNVIATNIKNYYQTVNSENNTLGDKSSTTQITNAGCPSTASDWTRYLFLCAMIQCVIRTCNVCDHRVFLRVSF